MDDKKARGTGISCRKSPIAAVPASILDQQPLVTARGKQTVTPAANRRPGVGLGRSASQGSQFEDRFGGTGAEKGTEIAADVLTRQVKPAARAEVWSDHARAGGRMVGDI